MVDAPTDRDAAAADDPADEPGSDTAASVPEAAFDVAPELFGVDDAGAVRRSDDTAL
jgi:hypothetical protein